MQSREIIAEAMLLLNILSQLPDRWDMEIRGAKTYSYASLYEKVEFFDLLLRVGPLSHLDLQRCVLLHIFKSWLPVSPYPKDWVAKRDCQRDQSFSFTFPALGTAALGNGNGGLH